jgi:hypothetical protein
MMMSHYSRRSYFTNAERIKKSDPYAILGLQWGDGATSSDIKAAFRLKARELHPDVNTTDSPELALQKFQELQKSYESIMKAVTGDDNSKLDLEEWRVGIWRQGDRIALDRTDVAGVKRNRPAQPASTKVYARTLGHPDGRGNHHSTRGEYLGDGKKTSSVGTGRNKWVQPKKFIPWNPEEHSLKKASKPKPK